MKETENFDQTIYIRKVREKIQEAQQEKAEEEEQKQQQEQNDSWRAYQDLSYNPVAMNLLGGGF